ncbi:MAG: hypothetical protein NWR72_02815 [Bacteroidia bacterium]|nr:hypothetical protein [Bacteroidia bacterium]
MRKRLQHIYQKNLLRVQTVLLETLDFVLYWLTPKLRLYREANRKAPLILFLGDSLQARIPRMARYLRREGSFDAELLVKAGKDFKVFDTQTFSRVLTYRSRWHLRRILAGTHPDDVHIIHAFTLPSYQIKDAIDYTDIPVVMDVQDMHVSYFGLQSPKLYMRIDMPMEAYAIRHSAGIVSQSIELTNACRVYGIEQRPPTLIFPVYCDDEQILIPPEKQQSGEIHVAYAGSIAGSFQDDQHFGSMKLFWLIQAFASQGIHFHIYPSPTMRFGELILAEYREWDAKEPFFHLHKSVPQQQLAEELSQYHYGLLPFFLEDTGRSANKLGLGSSQKLYNYIEVGLPVIISQDLAFQSWMARRYGAGIEVSKADFSDIRRKLEEVDYAERRAHLLAQRDKITLGKNIPRLVKFYQELRSISQNSY